MSPTWLIIAILTALAIGIAIAMTILTVGHQTEERPGYVDLTAIRCGRCKRPARLGYVLCRRCLRRERRAGRGRYPTAASLWPPVSRVRAQVPPAVSEAMRRGHEVYVAESGAIVTAPPGSLRSIPDGFERLSPDEFAAWFTIEGLRVHNRGDAA